MQTLDGGRIGIAAQSLGIAEGALEEAKAYHDQVLPAMQGVLNISLRNCLVNTMLPAPIKATLLIKAFSPYPNMGRPSRQVTVP